MTKKCRALAGLLVCSLLFTGLSGCGAKETAGDSNTPRTEETGDHDLSGGEWKEYGEIADSGETWSASGDWDDLVSGATASGMEKAGRSSAADGGFFYILESCLERSDAAEESVRRTHYLNRVDMLSLEAEQTELDLTDAGTLPPEEARELSGLAEALSAGEVWIADMDVLDGKVSLLLVRWEEGETVCAYALRFDGNKKAEGMTNLLPGLEESGILQGKGMPMGIARDREGHYFVSDSMGTGVCVLNEDGTFLNLMTPPGGADAAISHTCRLPDGQPVFECRDIESQILTLFCFEENGEKILYRGQGESAAARYVNSRGEVLWLDHNGILRWNAAEGKCERFYQAHGLNASRCEAVWEGPEGELTLACYNGEITSLYRLQPGEDAVQERVRVFQLYMDEKMREYAAEYSRKHPEAEIVIEAVEPGDDKGLLLNRLMAQMASGEGPDILVLHRRQLEILQERGVLADLSEALPGELREQIFEGVLRQGAIGNGLYGIAGEVSVGTLLVPEEVWQGETWAFQDVLSIMEERERGGAPCDRCISIYYSLTADEMLFDLALLDVGGRNSSLVDLEQGKCYFDTPEFIGLLEACKKYGEAPGSRAYMSDEERLAEVESGRALAFSVTGDLKQFSRGMAMAGEGYGCVGYPTEGASGNRVSSYQLAAVNAGTRHYQVAVDFLNYLLSEEVQRKQGTSTVRRDVLTANVAEHSSLESSPIFMNGENEYTALEGKPDGTSYLQEYVELLDTGVPETWERDELRGIVLEEAAAFFNGDKSAEDAAGVIQNRVQLYLDEGHF